MKKFTLLALILLVGWSCQKDQEQLTPVDPVPEAENIALTATSLSVNQALNNLAFVYRNFDGKTQVAKRIRKVDVITRRDLNASSTRGLTRSDIEEEAPLLYVINYENNEGFALLGADVQVPPIISIGDEGNFATQEYLDFVNSGTEEVFADLGDDTNVQNLQFAMVSNAITQKAVILPPIDLDTMTPLASYSDTTILLKCWPLLKSKWEQTPPYNYFSPSYTEIDTTLKSPTGCTPLAVSQILTSIAYHKNFSQPFSAIDESGREYSVDWKRLCDVVADTMSFNPSQYTPGLYTIAKLIRAVGIAVDAEYFSDRTEAYCDDVVDFFNQLGFTTDGVQQLTKDIAFDMIVNKNIPLYTSGSRYTDNYVPVGHAFVLDGWLRLEYCLDNHIAGDPLTRHQFDLVHVNFGYGGDYDGYYVMDSFDLSSSEFDNFIEEGDFPSVSVDRNYNFWLNCIPFDM